ncbi:hypothetical protein G3465_15235 [Shewanella baltica]|uniref:hypothetical protein n=1 Tax=Shewanella baltica TaxID=62322 RepID=UPI00217DF023|nr:hypothetical protein [Shewanella baltica]MCS6154246.1 hypothetical protein [Shewanella baltica]
MKIRVKGVAYEHAISSARTRLLIVQTDSERLSRADKANLLNLAADYRRLAVAIAEVESRDIPQLVQLDNSYFSAKVAADNAFLQEWEELECLF